MTENKANYYNGTYGKWRDTILNDGTMDIKTAAAYTTGTSFITGYLIFKDVARITGGTGIINEILLLENNNGSAAQLPNLKVYFFNDIPTSQTKNNTITWNSADLLKFVGECTIGAGTARSTNYSIKHLQSVNIEYECSSEDNTLYAWLEIASGTPTMAAGATVQMEIKINAD